MSFIHGPSPKPGILDIHAYVPGKSGPKTGKVHKLSAEVGLATLTGDIKHWREASLIWTLAGPTRFSV